MSLDWTTIYSPSDWVQQFQAQIRITPKPIDLGSVFDKSACYTTYISEPTRQALHNHGLDFLPDKMSDWSAMDLIILSSEDATLDYSLNTPIWEHLWDGVAKAQGYAKHTNKEWMLSEIKNNARDIPILCESADPFSYAMQLSDTNSLGVIILPHLQKTLLLDDTQYGDSIRFNHHSALCYTRNMARDILAISLHETGHLRSRCMYERFKIAGIIAEALDQCDIQITHEDISPDLQNAMHLRHEIEADFYSLQMLSHLERYNVIEKAPYYRDVYIGHRAIDAISGGAEHMSSVAITPDILRKSVNLLGFQEALVDLHGEFGKRKLLELEEDGYACTAQNSELYRHTKEIYETGVFKNAPLITVLLNQFLTAARAFAPEHFETGTSLDKRAIFEFRQALNYKL